MHPVSHSVAICIYQVLRRVGDWCTIFSVVSLTVFLCQNISADQREIISINQTSYKEEVSQKLYNSISQYFQRRMLHNLLNMMHNTTTYVYNLLLRQQSVQSEASSAPLQ